MANTKDVLSKVWLRGSDGVFSRRLCGGRIVDHLATEQPKYSLRQADMVVRNDSHSFEIVNLQEYDAAELLASDD